MTSAQQMAAVLWLSVVALKLGGVVAWSWPLVLAPMWLFAAALAFSFFVVALAVVVKAVFLCPPPRREGGDA